MEIALILLASALMLSGIIGCILPFLPGPPLSFVALLILYFLPGSTLSNNILLATGIATVVVSLLDFIIPIWGTKHFGGSKKGVWGATIGLLAGMFLFPPFGIFIGTFLGAFIGELLNNSSNSNAAFRAALGSLIGFLIGTGLKLIICLWMLFHFIIHLIDFTRQYFS